MVICGVPFRDFFIRRTALLVSVDMSCKAGPRQEMKSAYSIESVVLGRRLEERYEKNMDNPSEAIELSMKGSRPTSANRTMYGLIVMARSAAGGAHRSAVYPAATNKKGYVDVDGYRLVKRSSREAECGPFMCAGWDCREARSPTSWFHNT